MLLLLLLMQIILMVRLLLLLLDVQIVVMNGFLTPLLVFICALIKISSLHMILSKVKVQLGWMVIAHVKLLKLDLFKLGPVWFKGFSHEK